MPIPDDAACSALAPREGRELQTWFRETDMHDSGFKRWMVLGALASASWLVSACGALPQQGNTYAVAPGFVRPAEQAGYNGTIRDIPTSIDPRTPEADGVHGWARFRAWVSRASNRSRRVTRYISWSASSSGRDRMRASSTCSQLTSCSNVA